MNKVELVGRLAKEPELRSTASGKSVCNFSLAVDRRFKQDGQPTADFFNIVAWGKKGETISQYVAKGQQIALAGRLQNRSYQAKDGSKRYATDIVLEEFTFISGQNPRTQGEQNDGFDAMAGFMPLDDDMPF